MDSDTGAAETHPFPERGAAQNEGGAPTAAGASPAASQTAQPADEPEISFTRPRGCYTKVQREGLVLAATAQFPHYGSGVYTVDDDGTTCLVNLGAGSGTCDFYRKTRPRTQCRHFWAVAYQNRPPTPDELTPPLVFEPMPKAIEVHSAQAPDVRTVFGGGFSTKDRKAYEKALQSEFPGVMGLARDVFREHALDELWKPTNESATGRHAFPLWTMLFANFVRTYNRYSLRRAAGFLQMFVSSAYLEVAPLYGAMAQFNGSPSTTPILEELLYLTALPFQQLGQFRLAADGTGWSSSRFGDYREERRHHDNREGGDPKPGSKRRAEAREQLWWRVVTVCEVDAFCVLSAYISGERVGEQTAFKRMLPGLVSRGWNVHSFRLDAGFDDTVLRDMMIEIGYDPLIPYRDNRVNAIPRKHVGKVRHPEVLQRLFHQFSMQNDEFKREYGSRAKAESLFSSIERVFGKYVDSRTEIAARNEILMMLICHNLRMLHIGQTILESQDSKLRLIAS